MEDLPPVDSVGKLIACQLPVVWRSTTLYRCITSSAREKEGSQNVTFDPLYLENFLKLECHRCLMAQP